MGIRDFLGIGPSPSPSPSRASTDSDMVRRVVDALDHLEEGRARYLAAFGYLLSRVANADLRISPEEMREMERLVVVHGKLPEDQAIIVVQMAKQRTQLFGGTDNFLVTREFDRMGTREQKLELLDCLYAVSAAEDEVSLVEDNEIRQIASELHLDHPDFIAIRSRWAKRLKVMQNLPKSGE